ncbi:MAG: SDR family oxidoreductase [Acidobacteriota bacterium]|nr:SDR family oxidoreductase [Acidobacteriota bacterium]
MAVKLKKLDEQVMVITGASSGIGLSTARMAAKQGARLVLAARSENALRQLTDEIKGQGGEAVYVVADVGQREDVQAIARKAQEAFGGFDTWVNNAGTGMYGKLEKVAIEDMRKLFETNLWGLIYGSLEAVKHLKQRGGALINIGSTVSERAIPLQGIYSASKHAVKGFTDALRMELEHEDAPISVTLVKPGAIDTPFPINAKNYLEREPQHVPPVYAPEVVADAILHCAETPVRDVFAGGGGKGNAALGHYAPRLADLYMESSVISGTKSDKPPRPRDQNGLDRPTEHLAERGDYEGHVAKSSLYTQASLHPVLAGAAVVGAGLVIASLWRAAQDGAARQQRPERQRRSPAGPAQQNLRRFTEATEAGETTAVEGQPLGRSATAGR